MTRATLDSRAGWGGGGVQACGPGSQRLLRVNVSVFVVGSVSHCGSSPVQPAPSPKELGGATENECVSPLTVMTQPTPAQLPQDPEIWSRQQRESWVSGSQHKRWSQSPENQGGVGGALSFSSKPSSQSPV